MASDDYASIPSVGKLKLKGVKDSKVVKKKKQKTSSIGKVDGKPAEDAFEDRSVILKKLEEEDRAMKTEGREKEGRPEASQELVRQNEKDADVEIDLGNRAKTEAERRYEEQRRKRVCSSDCGVHFLL